MIEMGAGGLRAEIDPDRLVWRVSDALGVWGPWTPAMSLEAAVRACVEALDPFGRGT